MDSLALYASSDDEDASKASSPASPPPQGAFAVLPAVNSAPLVVPSSSSSDAAGSQSNAALALAAASQKQLALNLPVDATLAPVYGPTSAFSDSNAIVSAVIEAGSGKQVVTGVVERADVDDLSFEAQYHTYNQQQQALRPQQKRGKGALPPPPSFNADSIVPPSDDNVFTVPNSNKKKGKKRPQPTDEHVNLGDADVHGIWAPYKDKNSVPTDAEAGTMTEEQIKLREEYQEAKRRRAEAKEAFDEEMDFDRMVEKKTGHLLPARLKAGQTAGEATSKFLGSQEYDYQGRSWVEPPRALRNVDPADHDVFLPKRCIHTWKGHTKGVQAIELFPRVGHLLLSGSLDHSLRIWDVMNDRECQRVYNGHTGAVRGIHFSNDGRQFLSCSFDRFIRLWDTETGQSVASFTNRRVPYCVKFYPEDNSSFVIGDSNNMVVQFDARSGEIAQEYNHHLQAVNSVTFVDDNRRFVSTSDDKKILVWEWGIPVPIKYISEPSMHSMPAVTIHPSGGFLAGQSLNNQIDVYTARDKFKRVRNKVFKGHTVAGYACQLGFSPNGQYLVSGDGEGKLAFWDWKSTKMLKKLRAHDKGPAMGVAWHPLEPSKVVSCGWDGLIKLWD